MKTIASILGILLVCITTYAGTFRDFAGPTQTNMYYNAGENTVEATPSISYNTALHKYTYGASAEYEHWTSLTLGTGIEIGTYDVKSNPNGIDHISIMQDYRLVEAPQSFLLGKFVLVGKMGVETFLNGSKGLEFGVGVNYNLFVKRCRLEIDYMQHIGTSSSNSEGTLRFGLQYIF
jgi:hypothetical protein